MTDAVGALNLGQQAPLYKSYDDAVLVLSRVGACAVGAYDDQGVNELLANDGSEQVSVYLLSLSQV
jgi:hypothetical protein